MIDKPFLFSATGVPASPALNVLRVCAMAAMTDGSLDDESLALLARHVQDGALAELDPREAWPELARGLLADVPSRMLAALQSCGALECLLPELEALSGVPIADSSGELVDLGQHVARLCDGLARRRAPLALICAALFCHLGKADSPPEHLPTHYRHVERAIPRIERLHARFGLDPAWLDLALLSLHELERVHKATESRAGALTMMLERIDAFARPQRFEQLLQLCEADFLAFPSSRGQRYAKAPMLRAALEAAQSVSAEDPEALREARAMAVARRLRSQRWAEEA